MCRNGGAGMALHQGQTVSTLRPDACNYHRHFVHGVMPVNRLRVPLP